MNQRPGLHVLTTISMLESCEAQKFLFDIGFCVRGSCCGGCCCCSMGFFTIWMVVPFVSNISSTFLEFCVNMTTVCLLNFEPKTICHFFGGEIRHTASPDVTLQCMCI